MSYGDPAPFPSKSVTDAGFYGVLLRLIFVSAYGYVVTRIAWDFGPRWLGWVSIVVLIPILAFTVICVLVAVCDGVDAIVRKIRRAAK
jgi:fructose-specific phosphotransferase system IIC component